MKKRMIMILAGVLAMVLLFTACNTTDNKPTTEPTTATDPTEAADPNDEKALLQRNDVVATAGAFKLTNSQLQVFYALQVRNYLDQFGAYVSYSGIDVTKSLSEQVYDEKTGETWQDHFLKAALAEWKQFCSIVEKANENKFEIPAEYAAELDALEKTIQTSATQAGFKSVNEMLQADLGATVEYEDYYNYVVLYYTSNLYIEELMMQIEVTDDDIEQYFKDNEEELKTSHGIDKESGNCVDVRHILIMPEGGTKNESGTTTTYSDAEWETCRQKAQAVYDEWLAGDKTEDSFGALANEKSQDQGGQVTNGGIYENVTKGRMVKEFEDWCFDESRQPGDHGLVKTQYGYHVMYFVEAEAIWSRYCELSFRNEEVQKLAEGYLEALTYQVENDKIVLANIKLS